MNDTDTDSRQPTQPAPRAALAGAAWLGRRVAHGHTSTPALERLIARAKAQVDRLIWLHALGTIAAAISGWLLFAFIADWTLHLPSGVRWVNLFVLGAVPVFFCVRELVRPLRVRPDAQGLAVLIERAHPELKQLLVSAVQLDKSLRPAGHPELIDGLLLDAESAASRLDLEGVFAPHGPRLRFLCGALAGTLCTAIMIFNAEAAQVFFLRLAGGSTPWPQRTHLTVEIPLSNERQGAPVKPASPAPVSSAVRAETDELVVRVARGSDVPVLVRAQGLVPEEVTLHFDGGHKAVLASSGGSLFRTLLRTCQEDLSFYVTGGDDTDEDPRVRLIVLQPPDVAGLALDIAPPEYSGLSARTLFDRDVEALSGSRISVHVLTDPPEATGMVRLLPEDRLVDLVPKPFPLDADAATDSAPKMGQGFELIAEKSLRYRFELTDASGMTNPDPGLFGITVIEDRAPEVEILAPARGDFDTVVGGLIALRARAEDDFGIARLSWVAAPGAESDRTPAAPAGDLEWRLLLAEERRDADTRGRERSPPATDTAAPSRIDRIERGERSARAAAIGKKRLEVNQLLSGEPVVEGQLVQLFVSATDNCQPKPHEGRAAPVRVRVVSTDEFLRRLQDRLTRVQASASGLSELQRDKLRRTQELLSGLESDDLLRDSAVSEISAALTGERRVQGDSRALARELCSLCESVLYARIDERSGSLLEFLDQRLSASTDRGFDPDPWRDLASAYKQGQLGAAALSGKLVDIAGLSLEISEGEAQSAVESLVRAQDTLELKEIHTQLLSATDSQKKTLAKIEHLLELLSEWDNFQSVLSLTRDILNGQKGLEERTRQVAKEK